MLPQLNDEQSKEIFNKITSYENLKIFVDQSLSPDERFNLTSPYFTLFPDLLDIYSEAELYNEALVITQFFMETLRTSTYLAQEKLNELSESRVNEFKIGFARGLLTVSSSTLDLIIDTEKQNIDDIYILNLSTWFNDNFTELADWLDEKGKAECKAKIKSLSKNGYPKEIRPIMKELEKKLN